MHSISNNMNYAIYKMLAISYPIKMVQQTIEATLFACNNYNAAGGFKHLGHDNGRRRVKHVTGSRPCVSHDENENGILECQYH